ncbi:heme biosynthesis HemY N-terminal domain-containing protein [Ferrimonas lipolytica]|uniref:HemY N-terminal domain-containing protein n=1 Tax=Ferrimonas lipolytica TaxID=2724191 RepID=A0A6H1UG90_9GAMM|nr:heme biosynthesis HemY N-terminal domain-containing protein [Ferrimonas lipolytica]QIZ78101.1 hypothetical protein HER31_15050 [Ferrimonas lipolytica]
MIRLLIYAVLVIAGLIAGPQLVEYKGYVMISVADYTVETSLVALVIIALVLFAGLQLLEWLVIKLINTTGATMLMPKRWRQRRAKQHTLSGFLALAEQDWSKAEKAMAKGAKAGEAPMINYFAAARAAHQRGDSEAWQGYLTQAEKQPDAITTAAITRVRYLLEDGEFEQARTQLDGLDAGVKSKPTVRRLALALYRKQQDWDALAELIPLISKDKALPAAELAQLPIEVEQARFAICETVDGVKNRWDALPRQLKKRQDLQVLYAQQLVRLGANDKARAFLLDKLPKGQPEEAMLNVLLDASAGAEEELGNVLRRKYPNADVAALEDCYGTLAERHKSYDKALNHRQQALANEATVARYQGVITLQEQLGQRDRALTNYRKMLELMQA